MANVPSKLCRCMALAQFWDFAHSKIRSNPNSPKNLSALKFQKPTHWIFCYKEIFTTELYNWSDNATCIMIVHLDQIYLELWVTCEQSVASSWKYPRLNSQNSRVVMMHWPWIPTQHGRPRISHFMCLSSTPFGTGDVSIHTFMGKYTQYNFNIFHSE